LLGLASANLERMVRLLESLLELSRLESGGEGACVAVDAVAAAREAGEGLFVAAGRPELTFLVEAAGGVPPVRGEPDLVARLLNNLLANAFRHARSRVTVEAALRQSAAGAPACVEMRVCDDGPGIAKDRLGDLFEKYVQLGRPSDGGAYKGTGLGLAICRQIVRRLGGTIWAESEPGRGASFRFVLPAFVAEPAAPARRALSPAPFAAS
jgi:signal transduction histidine kinase